MYEEDAEPTADERINFLRRVENANDQDLFNVINHPERYRLSRWQLEIAKEERWRRLRRQCSLVKEAEERLRTCTKREEMNEETKDFELARLESYLRERSLHKQEEILKQGNQATAKTKTEKEETTMAANKTTEAAANETAAQATPKFDTKAIIGFKVAEMLTKAMDKGQGLPLTKITVMQNLADGKGLNVNEIVKAKYTENFMKELDANKDIPLGKLIAFQTLQENGAMDINAICQAKFVEKLFNDFDNEDQPAATEQPAAEQKK